MSSTNTGSHPAASSIAWTITRRLGMVIVLALAFFLSATLTIYTLFRIGDTRVPDVIGKPEAEAQKLVEKAPSILSADFARLGEEIQAAERGGAGLIHVDIMDGHFVPNITIGPLVVKAARKSTRLPLDCHLMITDPDRYIADFARAGANL